MCSHQAAVGPDDASWPRRVAILGTGMLGGSMAAALRERHSKTELIAYGVEPDVSRAMAMGLFDRQAVSVADAVAGADLVVLAAPISVNCALIPEVMAHLPADAVLTDVSSVKGGIEAAMRQAAGAPSRQSQQQSQPRSRSAARPRGQTSPDVPPSQSLQPAPSALSGSDVLARCVLSHPIAGSEKAGPDAGSARLFAGRSVVLSALPESSPGVVERLAALWRQLGARIDRMTVADHDRVFAKVSHWPHAMAFALAAAVGADRGAPPAGSHAGSGLLDMTRIAASSPTLWADILLHNRDYSLRAADAARTQLTAVEEALRAGDRERLTELFALGAAWRRRY